MRRARRLGVSPASMGVCLTLLLTTTLLSAGAADRSRADELKQVIDRNTGFAHMTRGVKTYTLIALGSCVTERDVQVLAHLLTDRGHVTQPAAASVMADLGEAGKRELQQVIEDALREAESPMRQAILDSPLSQQERQRIRGCRPSGRE